MDRRVAGWNSEVKVRKHKMDLEAEITRLVAEGRYRHRDAARRHILMDKQQNWRKKQYRRAVRRAERQLLQEAV